NPEKVIIGGGVSEAGDWFVARIEAAAINLAMKAATREVTVMRARLGNKAGLLGAAAFALDQEGHA
ncbi:MAG: ROK family protein, partial [Calditrichaeota bacterium]|nr:ROK family protein [Calditrichota bacterium]